MDAVVRGWNWKTGLLSAIYRALIFFGFTIRHGWEAASMAFFLETAFRVVTSGVYGAVLQRLSGAQPGWSSALVCMVLLPALIQTAEFLLHWIAGTPNLKAASIVSTVMAAVSALFNWYVMRRGVLVSGKGARSLGDDMKQMPRLVFDFVMAAPRAIARLLIVA